MFNDLLLTRDEKKLVAAQDGLDSGAGGDPLLEIHRSNIRQLARVMARLPNAIFVGPGNARLWNLTYHFDKGSACMLETLIDYGITHINAVEIMQGMSKRGRMHFENTNINRTLACSMLENAIEISDAQLKLGLARHFLELAMDHPHIEVRPAEPLPSATQGIVNDQVRLMDTHKQT